MDWTAIFTNAATLAGLLITGFGLAITGTWKLANMEKRQSAEREQDRKEIHAIIDEVRAVALEQAELARREFGETLRALQAKIATVEVDALKTFVRRDSFFQMQQAAEVSMKAQFDRIDGRFDRMESKLDALQVPRSA